MEIELKFQVPESARAAVLQAVATTTATTTTMRARYFDTADRRLSAAGVALRLRREGRVWVQTLKAAGASLARRLEHEVALGPGVPMLDLHRHDGTAAAEALAAALGRDAPPLQLVFETEVRRTHRILRSGGAAVELALDIGQLRAGSRRAPLCELELELVRGPVSALYALASRWASRHGLWLDVRSKAERGELLSRGLAAQPPVSDAPSQLHADLGVDQALRRMVGAALAQALPNAAALAADAGAAEHLHQLRVGLRRLRSVLRLFAGDQTVADAAWPDTLAAVFRQLGDARDADVLQHGVLPALAAAGGPRLSVGDPATGDLGQVLRQPACTALMLSLMAYADDPGPATDGAPIGALAAHALARLDRRLAREARGFAQLDTAQQHRLRRRIKRLRYGVEATRSLWPRRALNRYLAGLKPIQEALGEVNDLLLAQAWFDRHIGTSRMAAAHRDFVAHWLATRQAQAQHAAAQALRHWPDAPRAWRAR